MSIEFWTIITGKPEVLQLLIFHLTSNTFLTHLRKYSLYYLDFLPIRAPTCEHEVIIYVILLMREVGVCIDVYHPGSTITTNTQDQGIEI